MFGNLFLYVIKVFVYFIGQGAKMGAYALFDKSGKITLHEAAEELHESGWTNFIDEDAARRLLKL